MHNISYYLKYIVVIIFISLIAVSCTSSGPAGFFGKKSPHEQYEDKIKNAGLQQTALGKLWMAAAEQSLKSPLLVNLPYSEIGYFPAEQPKAVGLLFHGKRGEKINISLTKKPQNDFDIYLDLWEADTTNNTNRKFLVSADTTNYNVTYEVGKDGSYILRLQPELLKGGEYTLSVSTGPSLAFPIAPKVKANIGSFWGAGRDRGARKHEGIDIFAPRGAPAVAAAGGFIRSVTENALGGNVIFLRPSGKDYTLYYAHLDKQLLQPGQEVRVGDTIGLVGNTGNARTTAPHLHFGIYTNTGAIDPLNFVYTVTKKAEKITAPLSNLNTLVRTKRPVKLYTAPATSTRDAIWLAANTLMKPEAATAGWYRVSLPDGQKGFVSSANVNAASSPVRNIQVKTEQPLLDSPNTFASRKTTLTVGESVSVLAAYKDFYYVRNSNSQEGWIFKTSL